MLLTRDSLLDSTLSLFVFTDLFQVSFNCWILSLMAASLGLPEHILCLSIDPIAFPIPESLTTDLVTGSFVMFESK